MRLIQLNKKLNYLELMRKRRRQLDIMDNTKINNFQEKILQAMQIISEKTLESVSYDTTIVATIQDNADKADGKYVLTDGTKTFTAYSTVTSYSKNTSVFVTIPNGNWENQKIIIGKKTSEEDSPFVYTNPFDNFFALTANLAKDVSEGQLLINDIDQTDKDNATPLEECLTSQILLDAEIRVKKKTENEEDADGSEESKIIYVDEPVVGCSYLGIRANFQSWIKEAVSGSYALTVILTAKKPLTVKELEEGKKTQEEKEFPFIFSNQAMFGNVYNFENYYQQEIIAKLEEDDIGEVTHIKIVFSQNADFYDIDGELLPTTIDGWARYDDPGEKSLFNAYKRYGDEIIENKLVPGNGYYIGKGETLEPNLFVKDIEVYLGEDLSTYSSDYIRIYTADTKSYKRSTALETDNSERNKKNIKLRWVHIDKDGKPVDMINNGAALNYEIRWYRYKVGAAAADEYSSIYWTSIGELSENWEEIQEKTNKIAANEDMIITNEDAITANEDIILEIKKNENLSEEEKESQIWEVEEKNIALEEKNKALEEENINLENELKELRNREASLIFSPDVNKQQEKIKAIAFIDGVAYRSNELVFTNDEIMPLDAESYHILNALSIDTDDNSNGNYFIYGQNDEIKDTGESKKTRTLSAYFDVNNDGIIDKNNEKIASIGYTIDEEGKRIDNKSSLKWIFPAKNSMLKLINGNEATEVEEGKTPYNNVFVASGEEQPQYVIQSIYSSSYSNNTVICEYILNGVVYTTEKEFVFGPLGTMGYEETLFIKIVGDNHAVLAEGGVDERGNSTNVAFEVFLRDAQGKYQEIPEGAVEWSWYYCIDKELNFNKLTSQIEENGEIKELAYIRGNSILNLVENEFKINHLYILQASVGDLTTYFPVPVRTAGYNYIKGCTEVRYQTNGMPQYSKEPYAIYNNSNDIVTDASWDIFFDKTFNNENEKTEETRYIGSMYTYEKENIYKLQPLSIYVENALVYGVQAKKGSQIIWTQPILVIQNRWSSTTINKWDGKTLTLNDATGSILAAAISAGKKENDNSFTGVMLGDWGERSNDTNKVVSQNTGVYGFNHGQMSYAFKDDGTAFIGKSGIGQINFDGNKGIIQSASYGLENVKKGIKMDLTYPYLLLSSKKEGEAASSVATYPFQIGSKFKVKWDGTIYAANGEFTGVIKGSSITSDSSINGSIITGGKITGSEIFSDKIYIGAGSYYTYEYRIQNYDGSWPDEWIKGQSLFEKTEGVHGDIQYRNVEKNLESYNALLGSFQGSDGNTTTPVVGIQSTERSVALETTQNIRLGNIAEDPKKGTQIIYLQANEIEFVSPDKNTIPAANQRGIYARFA